MLYRAFFALPPTLATSTGLVTNAVYGFTSMIIKLLSQEKPYGIAVAWDKGKPHRLKEYEHYKAHRKPAAEELIEQFPLARDILAALRIPTFEIEGYEADDILASMASQAEKNNFDAIIVTGDKDAFQLISENVKVMTTRRGITDIVIYDKDRLDERYGIPPFLIVDMLGLKGDPSDNIPGVPGIGEKTAVSLVKNYGTIENIFSNIEEIKPDRIKKALKENKEQALLSKKLAILKRDLDLKIDYGSLKWDGPDEKAVKQIFNTLEFKGLAERLFSNAQPDHRKSDFKVDFEEQDINWLQLKLSGLECAFAFIDELLIVGVHDGKQTYVCRIDGQADESIKNLLKAPKKTILTDAKKVMRKNNIISTKEIGQVFDTALAGYVNDPSFGDYSIEGLARHYMDTDLPAIQAGRSEETKNSEDALMQVAARAETAYKLYKILQNELKNNDLEILYENVELPLIDVLIHMERRGVKIDTDFLYRLSKELSREIENIKVRIFEIAEGEFNINSTQQLAEVLFDKLGLKATIKTKSGFSTSATALVSIREEHPIIDLVLSYRELAKLKNTYIDIIPELVEKGTGRIHTTFHQTVTSTGRLSSSSPNIQNIPIRTPVGSKIRKSFIASTEQDNLLVADYSQIELRILAHLSGDKTLIEAFRSGEDVHTRTASEVFDVPVGEIDKSLRRKAKVVNFGIVYGISPRGLAESLGVLPGEAKEYIDLYFKKYSGVKAYIEKTIENAYRQGFVTTLLNRRRYLPELKSPNFRIRSFGERTAVNTPIQGSAADIIKVAMINIHNMLHERNTRTEMILQVHDELVFELNQDEEYLIDEIRNLMVSAYPLMPELKINLGIGYNWQELKTINIH